MNAPDMIVHRGVFTTLDRSNPTVSAVAIKGVSPRTATLIDHSTRKSSVAGLRSENLALRKERDR